MIKKMSLSPDFHCHIDNYYYHLTILTQLADLLNILTSSMKNSGFIQISIIPKRRSQTDSRNYHISVDIHCLFAYKCMAHMGKHLGLPFAACFYSVKVVFSKLSNPG